MANKMTRREMYEKVIAHTVDAEERAFLEAELAKILHKEENKKPTETQLANEEIKNRIYSFLSDCTEPVTITEVEHFLEKEYSNQKVARLMNDMTKAEDGRLTKEYIKKVPHFRVA